VGDCHVSQGVPCSIHTRFLDTGERRGTYGGIASMDCCDASGGNDNDLSEHCVFPCFEQTSARIVGLEVVKQDTQNVNNERLILYR
jgi:hypothetical protein